MELHENGSSGLRQVELEKASGTVIPANSFVTLDSGGLAIVAVAGSTALAYTISGAKNGETTLNIVSNLDAVYSVTADANFAKANRGVAYNINTSGQTLDVGSSTTAVLKVLPGTEAGTVGSTDNVLVRINKAL